MRIIIKALVFLGVVLLALPFVIAVFVCPPGRGAKAYRVEQDFQAIHKILGTDGKNSEGGPRPRPWSEVVKKVPVDPWGAPYRSKLLARDKWTWGWELRSAGPDGIFDNGDDLTDETW